MLTLLNTLQRIYVYHRFYNHLRVCINPLIYKLYGGVVFLFYIMGYNLGVCKP